MRFQIPSLADLAHAPFDTVIDVRSPAEFAQDHIPGAINLPALDNEERAKVGTIYVQEDPFLAHKIGAALVARNVAGHIETALADKTGGWRPLVYCWRGGQRSGAFTTILQQIGWRAQQLDGGYQTYRRGVHDLLYQTQLPYPLIVVDGGTGVGKTALLDVLRDKGAQVLDLEGAAEHRGSLFGRMSDRQPFQKMFESRIAQVLAACDPARPVFVEAESNKIGQLIIPPMLWQAMIAAPRVIIEAPLNARAAFLVQTYPQLWQDPDILRARLKTLARYHGAEQVALWDGLAVAGQFQELAADLIRIHYDPRYRQRDGRVLASQTLDQITDVSLQALADQLLAIADKSLD